MQIKGNFQTVLKVDEVLDKYDVVGKDVSQSVKLFREHWTKVDRERLRQNIASIDRVLESGDSQGKKVRVRAGICKELDQYRETYDSLDAVMTSVVTKKLLPEIRRKQQMGQYLNPLAQAKFKLTMMPSVGFFIVAPQSSIQLHLEESFEEDDEQIDQIDRLLKEYALELDWEYCFK